MKPYSTTLALTLLFLANCQGFHLFTSANSALEEAENTAREGNTKEAILLYQQHLEKRLAVKDRPDWENPYLYLLTIGDLELQQGNVDAALEYYQQAETKQVSKELISDRYRGVALKYESTNQLEQACTILKKYRDRDPLLFDGMLDRISKEIVTREELAHSHQK
jgi:tetratricopeptide (TPR) repeat protein